MKSSDIIRNRVAKFYYSVHVKALSLTHSHKTYSTLFFIISKLN